MGKMKIIDWVSIVALEIGGIAWGSIGIFKFDIVANIFGNMTPITRIIYGVVGLASIYSIYTLYKLKK